MVNWNTNASNEVIYHEVYRSTLESMTENNDMAEDSKVYHVTLPVSAALTYNQS